MTRVNRKPLKRPVGGYFLLNPDHTVRRVSLGRWAKWFEHAPDSRIARHTLDGITVSTVFLGADHNFSSQGPPILFETMVFIDREGFQSFGVNRYSTWDTARAGHFQMCRQVFEPGWKETQLAQMREAERAISDQVDDDRANPQGSV